MNRLENVQNRCLRNIYGYSLSYDELLEISGLETIEERRKKALHKFAHKAVNNPQFENWFPLNQNRTGRHGKKYVKMLAKGNRLYRSPLYAMRRILNETPMHDRHSNLNVMDLSHLFNTA